MAASRVAIGLTIALVMSGEPGVAQTALSHLDHADVERFTDAFLADYLRSPYPSLAAVVVADGEVVLAKGYGFERMEPRRPVDTDSTAFYMASLSKPVTAALALSLVRSGALALDEDVSRWVPGLVPERRGWRPVRLFDLLTHTSGIEEPFMAFAARARSGGLSAWFRENPLKRGSPPGERYRYSNAGYGLVGLILERATGTRFEELARRRVFAPLGMTRATFRQPLPPELAGRLATAGRGADPEPIALGPAGAMVATPADMGRFLVGMLDGPELGRPRWRGDPRIPGAAAGWVETDLSATPGLFHTGARGHFSILYLVPDQRIGVFLVHSMRQGGPFQSLRADYVRAFAQRYLASEGSPTLPSTASSHDSPATPEDALAGTYRPLLLAETTIERAGYLVLDATVRVPAPGRLEIRLPGLGSLSARRESGGIYRVDSGPHTGMALAFGKRDGRAMIVAGGGLDEPLTFVELPLRNRGRVHLVVVGGVGLLFAGTAVTRGVRAIRRRSTGYPAERLPWRIATGIGAVGIALPIVVAAGVLTAPDTGASHRVQLLAGLVRGALTACGIGALALLLLTALAWRRGTGSFVSRVFLTVLAAGGIAAVLLLRIYGLTV